MFDKLTTELSGIYAEIETLKPNAEVEAPKPNYAMDTEYVKLEASIAVIEDELGTPASDISVSLMAERARMQSALDDITKILALRNVSKDTTARIHDLKAEEKKLAQQIATQEKLLNQLEKFVTRKCNILEERINGLFPTVRWKLFKDQINGGIEDCCECLIGGVPFADANNAARINAGLEIADVIAQHSDVTAPVFVDNAEAVNELRPISGQTIALLVSSDEKLRVETASEAA
jgi:hypothetical protein